MTIGAVNNRKVQYTANGSNTVFAYDFIIYDEDDIEVYLDDTLKTITTHYTVSGVGSDSGGNITFVTAPANGVVVTLLGDEPFTQEITFVDGDDFPSDAINEALDRACIRDQQLQEQIDRAILLSPTATASGITFPDPTGDSGKYLRVKSTEDGYEHFDISGAGNLSVSAYIETLLDDTTAAAARTTLGLGTAAVENIATINASIQAIVPKKYISGLYATSANYSSSTVASFTLADGECTDSTGVSFLRATGLSWNITNGNAANGYQGGTTLPNSSTIHFYVIALAADTSWTATFASTSLTPTLPGSYTKYRRVFSLRTNSSGVLLAGTWTERGGGRLAYRLTTPVLDVNTTNPGTSQVTATLASVPTGIVLTSILNVAMNSGNSTGTLIVQPLTQSDLAPSNSAAPGGTINIGATNQVAHAPELTIDTNTSAQVAYRSSNGGTTAVVMVTVLGWEDSRV